MSQTALQKVALGDQAAFRTVMDQYGGLVWSLARRMSASNTDAEDAVQEIFLDLWKSAARFDPAVASETTFIAMIARRRLIDRLRKSGRQPTAEALVEPTLPSAGVDPSRLSELGDEVSVAHRALAQLPEVQQRVLKLSIHRGLAHEKIAQVTGLPLGTVKTHSRRGLIRLRELLESHSDQHPQNPRVEVSS